MTSSALRDHPLPRYADAALVDRALAQTPASNYVLTSSFELARAGVAVQWVQRCALEPLLVSVALRKGHPIELLIRDSHCFALSLLSDRDQAIVRRFETEDDSPLNVFDTLDVETLVTGAPCLKRAVLAIDCEVHRHLDIEADHEIYVGLVRDARLYALDLEEKPAIKRAPARRRASA